MTIRRAWPVAKKRHTCIECGRTIFVGSRYFYAVGNTIEVGGFYAVHEHPACYQRRTGQAPPAEVPA